MITHNNVQSAGKVTQILDRFQHRLSTIKLNTEGG